MAIQTLRASLRTNVSCPHCWQKFAPEEILWVASHPELVGDLRLGDDHQRRFLPTRFNVEGNALDSLGLPCQDLACPNCHLSVPRALLQTAPMFVSIAGTPSCGKSYFLASMTWRLRQCLPKYFGLSFTDADPQSNRILCEYEEQQFFNPDPDAVVKLAKTEEQGNMYSTVRFGDQVVSYPQPFLFTLRPNEGHPFFHQSKKISRVLCLYDNAGESFLPGKDTATNPVTRHMGLSQVLLFCFDPTQDPRLREDCKRHSHDQQVYDAPVTARQETVFHEITDRIRKHTGLGQQQRHSRPLIIIVTKFDAWWPLLGKQKRLPLPWNEAGSCALDLKLVDKVSDRVRSLLWKYSPELVGAAEGFAERVLYIPVSAIGRPPEPDPKNDKVVGVRPSTINPMWCEVPLLVAFARWGGKTIPIRKREASEFSEQ